MKAQTIKILIEYYKWIVSLSIFVITVAISLLTINEDYYSYKLLFLLGMVCLCINIVINILLIKRLIIYIIVSEKDELTSIDKIFISTMGIIKKYGLAQNALFFIGGLQIVSFFLINIL